MSQPLLSASQIIDAEDLAFEDVPVPEWGGTVRISEMNAADAVALSNDTRDSSTVGEDAIIMILIYACKDADGNRLFTKDDLLKLRKKNFDVLNRLNRVAMRLNKMDSASQAALKNASGVAPVGATPTP